MVRSRFYQVLRIAILSVLMLNGFLHARASGIAGTTLKDGGSGCSCHSSTPSTATTVTIAGPSTLSTGQTGTYTVTVLRSGTFNTGVDIASLAGALAPADGILKLNGNDLTHSANHSASGSYVYNFKYTAPLSVGSDTIYATGAGSSSTTPAWNFAPNFPVTVVLDTLPASLALTSPIGSEVWDGAVSKNITWSSHLVNSLKIEFTTDDGTTWATITDAASPASGVYTWSVPNITSTLCRVKISDAVNSLVSTSVGTFTINKSSFSSTLLLEENFVQPAGVTPLVGANGWAAVTGTISGTQIGFTADNLSFGKYPSNSGQAALITAGGTGKVFKNFLLPSGNSVVYLSFLIKVPTAAQTPTNHIIGFGSGDMSVAATYSLKTYCKWNATTLGYNFGLGGSASTYATTPTSLAAGSVALVVLKYDLTASTGDLYVFADTSVYPTTLPGTSEVHLTGVTAFSPSCVYMRSQSGSGNTIGCEIDGIRVLTAWGDVATSVKQNEVGTKSLTFDLKQNYPNPFNPSTAIAYNLPVGGHVTLSVLNLLGEEVMLLVDQNQNAGEHQINFNASQLTSGMYLYRLSSGNFSVTKKMMLVR